MKEFEKISIPHADSFVIKEFLEKKRIEDAIRKFNQTCHYSVHKYTIKITCFLKIYKLYITIRKTLEVDRNEILRIVTA